MAFSSVRDMVELCKESGKPLYEVDHLMHG